MGTVANFINDWQGGDSVRTELNRGIVTRWANQAQLIFADKSEILQGVWSPTITPTGNIAVPSDFLREIKDKVKWTADYFLTQIDYPTANLMTFSTTCYYSIWANTFYVWSASAGTPTIPYIKKPATITQATLETADFEIPAEHHFMFNTYFDAMFLRIRTSSVDEKQYAINMNMSRNLLKQFGDEASLIKFDNLYKTSPVPTTEGRLF